MQENKSFFEKLKARPFGQRLILFAATVIVWFLLISLVSEDSGNAVSNARNTQSYWLISVLFIGIISPLFFTYKKNSGANDPEDPDLA